MKIYLENDKTKDKRLKTNTFFLKKMGKEFYELDIWQKGYKLAIKVYKFTKLYPFDEKFGLISDTRRSANSIIANISEAHGRFYYQDKIRVLYIARGEIDEVRSHLALAYSQKYISAEDFSDLSKSYRSLTIDLNNYINNLANQKLSAGK